MKSMTRKTDKAWNTLIRELKIDLSKDINYVHANDIKNYTGQEPRNVAYMDRLSMLPLEFQQAGVFILPVKNGVYAIVRGKGYHAVEEVPGIVTKFPSRLPFPLLSAEYGTSEYQAVHYAHNCGLLEEFVGHGDLRLQIGGRKTSIRFSFRIDGYARVDVDGVQTEVDAGFEGRDVTVLVEAKNRQPSNFIIRQLFYPYRIWSTVTNKETLSILFHYDELSKIYTLHQYTFEDPDDYESIRLVKSGRYQLIERQTPLFSEKTLEAVLPPRNPKLTLRHEMPQANDVQKLLAFPFLVDQGHNRPEAMTKVQGYDPRQSDYYRHAMELLGFIKQHERNAPYRLTELGQEYVNLSAPERNELMTRQMFSLPVMYEILMQLLLRPSHSLTSEEVKDLVQRYAEKIGTRTIDRRVSTILSYLRWIGHNVGALRVDRKGTVSLPLWHQEKTLNF